MRKLLMIAVAGVGLLFIQPSTAQAQQWVPGNPYFAQNPVGRSYGPGVALPFTQPFNGLNRLLTWNMRYDPWTGLYFGIVSGNNSRSGFYAGTVVIRSTPYGSWYRFTPSAISSNRLRLNRELRN